MKILVIEDDELVANALTAILGHQNYVVEVATDGQTGLELIEAFDYELVLSDIVLPKLDGISLCKQVRSQGQTMPILLLTGQNNRHDKAMGLDAGADDYVVKPFDAEELVARIRALLRRASAHPQPFLQSGDLRLDPSSCEVTFQGKLLNLTPKEYGLLELFLRNGRHVFSCAAILEHLWVYEDTPGEEAVRTHIKGLRQKLKAVGAPTDLVETVYGIGYRLKSLQKNPDPVHPQARSTSDRPQFLAALADIWQRYQHRASEQVAGIEQAIAALQQNALTPELCQEALRSAHTLAGSLGTFGLAEGSRIARDIEQALKSQMPVAATLQPLVMALQQMIHQQIPDAPVPLQMVNEDQPLILMVGGDRGFAEELAQAVPTWNLQLAIAADLNAAHDEMGYHPPKLVLLDLSDAFPPAEGLLLLSELSQRVPPIPVVVLTQHHDLKERVEIARRGGRICLQKPVAAAEVFEAIIQVLQRSQQTQAKVMVVDDDPQILAVLKTLLEPWGLKVTTLADPENFWETLVAAAPDLLILDVEMPNLSGIDLCQVARNDAQWGGLPILFLTAHREAAVVNQVFAIGADDYVTKPLVGPELVARIINRLERIKLLRRLSETDPLTRLANAQKSSQDLESFLELAQRYHHPLCLAVIHLDRLHSINLELGHPIGDEILRLFSNLLRRSFHSSNDVVARWGGKEFVVGMYGITREAALKRLNDLKMALSRSPLTVSDGSKIQVTFRSGIAQFPDEGRTLQMLYRAADAALARSKEIQGGQDTYPPRTLQELGVNPNWESQRVGKSFR